MADVPPAHISSFVWHIRSLKAAIQGIQVYNCLIVALYGWWSSFYANLHMYHLLEDPDIPDIKILQVYGHWFCNGGFYS